MQWIILFELKELISIHYLHMINFVYYYCYRCCSILLFKKFLPAFYWTNEAWNEEIVVQCHWSNFLKCSTAYRTIHFGNIESFNWFWLSIWSTNSQILWLMTNIRYMWENHIAIIITTMIITCYSGTCWRRKNIFLKPKKKKVKFLKLSLKSSKNVWKEQKMRDKLPSTNGFHDAIRVKNLTTFCSR